MYSFYSPSTGSAEADAVADLLERGVLSTGERVEAFEAAFADLCGASHAVAVTSGSVALELALDAAGLRPGDGVVVSPFNCTAVLYSLRRRGLVPLFADVDEGTYNLDPEAVEAALESRPDARGLLLTPTYGLPAGVEALTSLAAEYDLTVINDFCQAPGAEVDGRPVGSYGSLGVCSFGATKNITTGEGGMVVTDDAGLAREVRATRSNSGVDREDPPTNVRMSDVEAAIGLVQLDRYPDLLARRRDVANAYRESLPSAVVPQAVPADTSHAYHRFAVRVPDRDALQAALADAGVETSVGIEKPLYEFKCVEAAARSQCPRTEGLLSEYLLLPMHAGLDAAAARDIAGTIASFYGE